MSREQLWRSILPILIILEWTQIPTIERAPYYIAKGTWKLFLTYTMPKASWTTHDGSPRSICDRAEFTSYLPCTSASLYVPLVTGLQSKGRLLTS
ncbi:hypothetical protein AMTR_s00042p00048360 [Amborella trichopoda]|uniref:Secreted protein n=1 Tax=Amborella trichopoda TaxID=13333 RepID=W1P7A4_AMBTC|nr:hypothetical protein AMTR_s00042p00048360 [Amborella trichopoda]